MGYIYKISNPFNDHVYIGQTINAIRTRWNNHRNSYLNATYWCTLFDAFEKYGFDNFQIEVIEECEDEDLNDREIYWIEQYNSYYDGYNSTKGGDGAAKLDYPLIHELWDAGLTTAEIAEQIGATRNGVRKALLPYKNYNVAEGRHRGAKKKGRTNGKPISQYDLQGNYIATFPNSTVAAESINMGRIESNNIRACANGKRKTAYGYIWRFVKEEDK